MATTNKINKALNIYPNPAAPNEHIHLTAIINGKNATAQLSIYNVNGKLMYTNSVASNNEGKIEHQINLNILQLKKGIYFVQLTSKQETLNNKFVVN